METRLINVLLIEDNPGDRRLIEEMVNQVDWPRIELSYAEKLSQVPLILENNSFDVALLDLSLPDSFGIDTVTAFKSLTFNLPIIVLTGFDDETIGLQAVQEGAQDFLSKNQIDSVNLARAILFAIERHRNQMVWKSQALLDPLTSLYNRRGLEELGNEQIKIAIQNNLSFSMLLIDIDNLKAINDSYGHDIGDQAIKRTAEILKSVFRASDLVARYGGDEFVVIIVGTNMHSLRFLKKRVEQSLTEHNKALSGEIEFGLSIGLAQSSHANHQNIDQLFKIADEDLYRQKNSKKGGK